MTVYTDCVIKAENLKFSFSKGKEFIKGINIDVHQGAVYGFLGPNGAGKTTVIRLLLGLLKDDFNSIRLFGQFLSGNRINILSRIGALIEQPSLYEHISGYDNLDIVRRIRKCSHKKLDEVLEIVKLKDAARHPVKTYSLGMKQRLGIALALIGGPELLILDEPANGLDPNGISEIRDLLAHLNYRGVTIFLSSHLLAEVEKIASHVGIIHEGNMIFQGTIGDLHRLQTADLYASLLTNMNQEAAQLLSGTYSIKLLEDKLLIKIQSKEQVDQIIKLLISQNIRIHEACLMKKNLEELFLSLTQNNA